jgi:methylglyoxal synthase
MRIALIAHDDKKDDLIEFVQGHADRLGNADLIATGTTGGRLNDETDLEVERMESGPLGGDMMIGAEIAREDCDAVFFLRDPLEAQPHEPDVSALLRICDVHDIPLATNLTSAHAILDSLAGK